MRACVRACVCVCARVRLCVSTYGAEGGGDDNVGVFVIANIVLKLGVFN